MKKVITIMIALIAIISIIYLYGVGNLSPRF